ncbi:MAG: right-handed parallel beta-helix repeat-containing protein [Kofleriaceae bacterium]|nr:right-handed parallel beta-helix repeat-containing protein [Kofleriaceae bacterium]
MTQWADQPKSSTQRSGYGFPRGSEFFGATERFNRYYTDASYQPSRTIYVSPGGGGNGTSADSPTSVSTGFSQIRAGQQLTFLASNTAYEGCWELDEDKSGTYDAPIVIYGERNADGSRGVTIDCCNTGRKSCFNLEAAHHVAIDGFIMRGGRYGIRTVGAGYAPSDNQVGIAIIDNEGAGQCGDPFFSGQSSWIVVHGNVAHGAGECDGHGIYLSNGGDYMLVKGNETYDNESSDFQVNADPISTCDDEGIAYSDPRCDGTVTEGLGQGVSEFLLIEDNYFHHGTGPGPNLTSVRSSIVRNNIIGPYARHGTSFWQETDNPKLGSQKNLVHHNLFMGNGSRHILQFINGSGQNDVRNNLIIAIGNAPVLLESDTSSNTMKGNFYVGRQRFDGYTPNSSERSADTLDPSWFQSFPVAMRESAQGFRPTSHAPFTRWGQLIPATPSDRGGRQRAEATSLGPYEMATPQKR